MKKTFSSIGLYKVCNCGNEMPIDKDQYKHTKEYKKGKLIEHVERTYVCNHCNRKIHSILEEKEE